MISAQTLRVCREGKPVPTFPDHALVAGWVGVVSAAWCSIGAIGSGGGSVDGSGTDTYRHSTAYGCTAIHAPAMDATMVNASARNATSSICGGVS